MDILALDALEVGGLVGTVGFPIAAYLLMYRLANETIKDMTESVRDLQDEIAKLRRELE